MAMGARDMIFQDARGRLGIMAGRGTVRGRTARVGFTDPEVGCADQARRRVGARRGGAWGGQGTQGRGSVEALHGTTGRGQGTEPVAVQ
jgi:hypothetical protein